MIKKLLLTTLLVTSINVGAETPKYAYITDNINIPMRYTRSLSNNIVQKLTTGDKVEVIRMFDGWTQVRYGNKNGWVISRYLASKPNAETRIKKLVSTNQKLLKKNQLLKRKVLELKKQLTRMERNVMRRELLLEENEQLEITREDLLNELKVSYINQIASRVKEKWRYQGAKDNWGCDVHILQDVNGKVRSVNLQSCNIDDSTKTKSFKNSIERAVYKASPLPTAPDASVFDREILFHFRVN